MRPTAGRERRWAPPAAAASAGLAAWAALGLALPLAKLPPSIPAALPAGAPLAGTPVALLLQLAGGALAGGAAGLLLRRAMRARRAPGARAAPPPLEPRRAAVKWGVPVGIVLAVYVLGLRPVLDAREPSVNPYDYGFGLAIALILLAAYLRRARREASSFPLESPAVKHRQRVRALPDARHAGLEEALDAWLQRGEGKERYLATLTEAALATGAPARTAEDLRAALEAPDPSGRRGSAPPAREAREARHADLLRILDQRAREPTDQGARRHG